MCLVTERLGPSSDADTKHTEVVQEQGTVRTGRRKDTGQASALGEEEIRPRNSEKRGQGPGRERGTDEARQCEARNKWGSGLVCRGQGGGDHSLVPDPDSRGPAASGPLLLPCLARLGPPSLRPSRRRPLAGAWLPPPRTAAAPAAAAPAAAPANSPNCQIPPPLGTSLGELRPETSGLTGETDTCCALIGCHTGGGFAWGRASRPRPSPPPSGPCSR